MTIKLLPVVLVLVLASCAREPTGIAVSEAVDDDSTSQSSGTEPTTEPSDTGDTASGDSSTPSVTGGGGEVPVGSGGLASSSVDGLALDSVVIQREGTTVVARFTVSSTRSTTFTWTYEMAGSISGPELGMPTGVTIIDSENGAAYGVLRPEGAVCICSPLGSLDNENPVEYFVTFDDPGIGDFELYIPTFPIVPVEGDVVGPPTDVAATGVEPATTNADGLILDAVAARQAGAWTAVEFQVTNPGTTTKTWTYELAAAISGSELGFPTGVTLFDSQSQAVTNPSEVDGRPCVCSHLGSIPAEGTATYFVFLDATLSTATSVTIPGFPQVSGVPVNG